MFPYWKIWNALQTCVSPLAALMLISPVLFQFGCMCCQNEHLPFLLCSLWQASHVFHCSLVLHFQWLMILSVICHLYPFFGVLFIQIISPLLVGCPFIVKLCTFFVEWRYGKFCIVLSQPRGFVFTFWCLQGPWKCKDYFVIWEGYL